MKYFKAIAAMSENRVIGAENRIPWHLPADFRWFKALTIGQVVVMGRKTFESIGRPLPQRTTVVLSASGFSYPGVQTVSTLGALNPASQECDMFICGGGTVYGEALPYCSDLYLTVVKRIVTGDAYFPSFEEYYDLVRIERDTPEFRIEHHRNRSPQAFR
jgi:dihydrofolate reductase